MVEFEMIDQILLTMLAQKVKSDFARDISPFKVIQSMGSFDLTPTKAGVEDSLHHWVIVAAEHNVLIQILLLREFLFV